MMHYWFMNYSIWRWECIPHLRLRTNWKWLKKSSYRLQLEFQQQSLQSQSCWIGIYLTLQRTWSHCLIGSAFSYQMNLPKKQLTALRVEKKNLFHSLSKLCHMSSILGTCYTHNKLLLQLNSLLLGL